jgi:hypothetical protein
MNSELKNAITIALIITALIFISLAGGFIVCTLVIFDIIEAPLIAKILSYIANILISMFFGVLIFYSIEGGNEK